MKKAAIILIIIIIIVITIIFSILFLNPNLTGSAIENQENENTYTYTKAICNNTHFCQDNEISCKGEEIVSVSPISGAAVQFDQDWEDPRDEEVIKKVC